jgi:hypothetical protein
LDTDERLVLADHPLPQAVLQVSSFSHLALQHLLTGMPVQLR